MWVCVFTGVCICPWGRAGSTGKASVRCTMVLSAGRVYLDCELEGGPKVKFPFSERTARAFSRAKAQISVLFLSLVVYLHNFVYF